MSQSLGMLEEWTLLDRRPYLDGVPIENLLEPLASESRPRAHSKRLDFQVNVTSWSPLVVAADRRLLLAIMRALTLCMIDNSDFGRLAWSTYPSDDNMTVSFELEAPTGFCRKECGKTDTWTRILENAGETVRMMGGDLAVWESPERLRIRLRLPQWITLASFGMRPAEASLAA